MPYLPENHEPPEDRLVFNYENRPPRPNLLDYREMGLIMNRQASTNTGWLSVAAVAGLSLCGICSLSLFMNFFWR